MITGHNSGTLFSSALSGLIGVTTSAASGWGGALLAVNNSQQAPQTGSATPLLTLPKVIVNGLSFLDRCSQLYEKLSHDGNFSCVNYTWIPDDLNYVSQSYSSVTGANNGGIITRADSYNDILAHYNHLVVRAAPPSNRAEVSFRGSCETYRDGDTVRFKTSVKAPYGWSATPSKNSKYGTVFIQFKMPLGAPHSAIRLSNDGNLQLTYKGITGVEHSIGHLNQNQNTDIEIKVKHSMNNDGSVEVKVDGQTKFTLTRAKTLDRSAGKGYIKMGMYTQIHSSRQLWFSNTEVCKKT